MIRIIGLGFLGLLILPFAYYAVGFGMAGLGDTLPQPHYLRSGDAAANVAIFSHMIFGAVITVLVPFQVIAPLRQRFPIWHRWAGRIIATAALVTAAGGLLYIGMRGTIGGMPMNIGFALYGVLTLVAAARMWGLAHSGRFQRHRVWALRFFWLAIGSWLYRVQYGLWYLATGGLWSNPDFTGAFDLAMNFAFYVPALIGVEIYLASAHNKPVAIQTERP